MCPTMASVQSPIWSLRYIGQRSTSLYQSTEAGGAARARRYGPSLSRGWVSSGCGGRRPGMNETNEGSRHGEAQRAAGQLSTLGLWFRVGQRRSAEQPLPDVLVADLLVARQPAPGLTTRQAVTVAAVTAIPQVGQRRWNLAV